MKAIEQHFLTFEFVDEFLKGDYSNESYRAILIVFQQLLKSNEQSWTKLVETEKISARISQFLCMEIPTRLRKCFPPPPLIQGCLEGLRFHQGNFGSKATLMRGRGGKICCGKWFSR